MTLPILNTSTGGASTPSISNKVGNDSSLEKIERTYSEELIIGICAPIGSYKDGVIANIKDIIHYKYGYECEVIKISEFIRRNMPAVMSSGELSRATEMRHLIEHGNQLREKYSSSAFLAELAILDIFKKRLGNVGDGGLAKLLGDYQMPELFDKTGEYEHVFKSNRKCYIIDSLKTREEVSLFRGVYRELFYFISISTPIKDRILNLSEKSLSQSESENLIERDSDEAKNVFGQKVRDTFVLGDFFINVSRKNTEQIYKKVERFLHLVFDTRVTTPTIHETAMYHAKSAATNSACLSRQVGAAVTDSQGKVLAVGWNDVPKFGGSLYQDAADNASSENDARCIFRTYSNEQKLIPGDGMCFNDYEKNVIAEELANLLVDLNLIEPSKKMDAQSALRNSKIKDLIEYSRAVHAEMHAIIIASQTSGASMKEAKLYCTTYPCHNCGRHIIASGIKEVYYIEPYAKSLSSRLHSDAITEDEEEQDKVKILMFEGVAPNRYLKFFSIHGKRKLSDGRAVVTRDVDLKKAKPRTQLTLRALPVLEVQALHALVSKGFNVA